MAFPARRRLGSGGALAVLVSLTGHAARAAAGSGRAVGPRGHHQAPHHQALLDAAEKIHHLGVLRFPHSYAGVEIRFPDCRLVVYRRRASGFDRAVRRSVPGVAVALHDAPHSARELAELAQWVCSERDLWRARGISVVRAVPRHDGSGVEVAVPDAEVRRAVPVLTARYGTAALVTGCRTPLKGGRLKVPRQWFPRMSRTPYREGRPG